jgi:uncharacterized protein (DUF952 family)
MIYRIAESTDWAAAQSSGRFASADLAAEGFIHFAERWQVQGVTERYYTGRSGLMLLAVDDTKLEVPVKRENTSGGGELFPHVYGPVPLPAVWAHAPLVLDGEGQVVWPMGW